MRYYLAALYVVLILAVPWFVLNYPDKATVIVSEIGDAGRQMAAVLLGHNPRTIAELQSKYHSAARSPDRKVRILIVPGHEPNNGGAEFGDIKERILSVELGQDLQRFLAANPHYQVSIARDTSAWSPTFDSYFKDNWDAIKAWTSASEKEESQLISLGTMKKSTASVQHNSAPSDVAYRLYGMTKWANENSIDITIHIHFNDYPGHPRNVPGTYSGFAIYVPEAQYANSTTTKAIATQVFRRISKYNPVSDLPGESSGIIDEPDLIAIGAHDTADSASMLIEYGYLYEKQFTDPALRSTALKDLAFQTYLGLQDFFDPTNVVNIAGASDTLLVPHQWQSLGTAHASTSQIYALQTGLIIDGEYPPSNKSLNDCPRSGNLGPCTLTALSAFQAKYGITDEKGVVGPKTAAQLNKLYSNSIKSI